MSGSRQRWERKNYPPKKACRVRATCLLSKLEKIEAREKKSFKQKRRHCEQVVIVIETRGPHRRVTGRYLT